MSLFGSLYTGVSTMNAQSQTTAVVSNNIANSNTIGFKSSDTSFSAFVTAQNRTSLYSPGTVSVSRSQNIEQQGTLQASGSSTHMSLDGNGFFTVKDGTGEEREFLYTRAGDFDEDRNGLLRNTAGYILYGWPLDADGELPLDTSATESLVPIDTSILNLYSRATTESTLEVLLDEGTQQNSPHLLATPTPLPANTDIPSDFSRGLTVYDTLGTAQNITMEYRKITGPMAEIYTDGTLTFEPDSALFTALGNTPSGNGITITVGGNAEIFEFVSSPGSSSITPPAGTRLNEVVTAQDYIDALNSFNGGNSISARLTEDGRIAIKALDPTAQILMGNTAGSPNTPLTSLGVQRSPASGGFTYDPDYNISTGAGPAGYDQTEFPEFEDINGANTEGWWEMTVRGPDGTILREGLLNFDETGELNATPDIDGNIDLTFSGVDWGNGSAPQDFTMHIGNITHKSGTSDLRLAEQNGTALGYRTGIEIDNEGVISARFSNGDRVDLYKVPVTTFSNPNELNEVSGTAYTESPDSGQRRYERAGSGEAGTMVVSQLERSNVDLANEFSKLIISQRSYSAGTRIVSTVDEMLQDLLRLRG